jgi:hypothetical protein
MLCWNRSIYKVEFQGPESGNPRSISTFFGSTTPYKKSQQEPKIFIDDVVLLVVKSLHPLNTIESIQMKWFGLQRDPQAMFPSWRTSVVRYRLNV